MTTTARARSAAPPGSADAHAAVGGAADLELLTGPDARDVVAGALVGDGPRPDGLRVDVAAVHHRPGLGVSVCYEVSHAGAAVPEVIVASTTEPTRGDGTDRVAVLDDGVRQVRVWRRADDPALPGLRAALTPATVAGWLERDDLPEIAVLTYRPTRRAVAMARWHDATVYLKVVRPRRAASLARRHRLLAQSAVPAPAVLGEPQPGVVVLADAVGGSLAQALASGDAAQVPTPASILAALDTLPDGVLELTRRPSWVDRLDFHAAAAQGALPTRAHEVADVVRRVEAVLAAVPASRTVPTHGDLNVANLFVRAGHPSSLIDVDSLGPGHREDDLATLLAHLSVLPALAPEQYPTVPAVVREWTAAFAEATEPRSLHARTAAVLVSLVAGAPPQQGHRRLDLALDHVARAESIGRLA